MVASSSAEIGKAAVKVALAMIGSYFLSNLTIFTSKHFIIPGLSEKDRKTMDDHNAFHHGLDQINAIGTGLMTGYPISKAPKLESKDILDEQVKDLPKDSGLVHTHDSTLII